MNCYKQQAFEIINRLHEENRLDNSDYFAVHDGLSEIEPLRDRDEVLEELWKQFGDIPMNPETECIEAPFMGWGVGIHREEIWHWFDARHSKGIAYLLYGNSVSRGLDLRNLSWRAHMRTVRPLHNRQSGVCRYSGGA